MYVFVIQFRYVWITIYYSKIPVKSHSTNLYSIKAIGSMACLQTDPFRSCLKISKCEMDGVFGPHPDDSILVPFQLCVGAVTAEARLPLRQVSPRPIMHD